jgi:hypothetical protein
VGADALLSPARPVTGRTGQGSASSSAAAAGGTEAMTAEAEPHRERPRWGGQALSGCRCGGGCPPPARATTGAQARPTSAGGDADRGRRSAPKQHRRAVRDGPTSDRDPPEYRPASDRDAVGGEPAVRRAHLLRLTGSAFSRPARPEPVHAARPGPAHAARPRPAHAARPRPTHAARPRPAQPLRHFWLAVPAQSQIWSFAPSAALLSLMSTHLLACTLTRSPAADSTNCCAPVPLQV